MSKSPNIIFITHPFYAVNNKDNTYKLYFGKNTKNKFKNIYLDFMNIVEMKKKVIFQCSIIF